MCLAFIECVSLNLWIKQTKSTFRLDIGDSEFCCTYHYSNVVFVLIVLKKFANAICFRFLLTVAKERSEKKIKKIYIYINIYIVDVKMSLHCPQR